MRTRQWIQALLLMGMGLYFLDNLVTGRIALYVNDAQFGWVPWLGTVLLLAIGSVQLVDLLRVRIVLHNQHVPEQEDACDDDCKCEHDDVAHPQDHEGHSHEQAPSWMKLALVSIPLAIGIFIPARPLTSAAISTGGINLGQSGAGVISGSFDIPPASRTILDWTRSFSSSTTLNQFIGQPVDVIGFVYKDIRLDGKPEFTVARLLMSCCVADVRGMGMIVQTHDADKWLADSWVHVTGKVVIQNTDGTPTPIVAADSVQAIDQPAHPYLYR